MFVLNHLEQYHVILLDRKEVLQFFQLLRVDFLKYLNLQQYDVQWIKHDNHHLQNDQ